MYNRYQGNSGQVRRVGEEPPPPPPGLPGPALGPMPPPPPPPRRSLLDALGRLLPGTREELESEDLLLMLILYLLYRESGDSELLIVLGAMLFL